MSLAAILCGGKNFKDYAVLKECLDKEHERYGLEIIIHGAEGGGVDDLADKWGRLNGALVIPIPAWWKRYGATAGTIRNGVMVKLLKIIPTERKAVIAFPGRDMTMVELAEKESESGIKLIKIGW